MTGSAVHAVLAAVRAALVASASVAAIVGDRVSSSVVPGTVTPYIDLSGWEVPDNTFGTFGRRVTVMWNGYSQADDEEVMRLLDASIVALDFGALEIDGWNLVSAAFESSQSPMEDQIQGVTTYQLPAYFIVTVNRA